MNMRLSALCYSLKTTHSWRLRSCWHVTILRIPTLSCLGHCCKSLPIYLSLSLYIYIYIYIHNVCIYIYIYIYICIYIYIYMYIVYTYTYMAPRRPPRPSRRRRARPPRSRRRSSSAACCPCRRPVVYLLLFCSAGCLQQFVTIALFACSLRVYVLWLMFVYCTCCRPRRTLTTRGLRT